MNQRTIKNMMTPPPGLPLDGSATAYAGGNQQINPVYTQTYAQLNQIQAIRVKKWTESQISQQGLTGKIKPGFFDHNGNIYASLVNPLTRNSNNLDHIVDENNPTYFCRLANRNGIEPVDGRVVLAVPFGFPDVSTNAYDTNFLVYYPAVSSPGTFDVIKITGTEMITIPDTLVADSPCIFQGLIQTVTPATNCNRFVDNNPDPECYVFTMAWDERLTISIPATGNKTELQKGQYYFGKLVGKFNDKPCYVVQNEEYGKVSRFKLQAELVPGGQALAYHEYYDSAMADYQNGRTITVKDYLGSFAGAMGDIGFCVHFPDSTFYEIIQIDPKPLAVLQIDTDTEARVAPDTIGDNAQCVWSAHVVQYDNTIPCQDPVEDTLVWVYSITWREDSDTQQPLHVGERYFAQRVGDLTVGEGDDATRPLYRIKNEEYRKLDRLQLTTDLDQDTGTATARLLIWNGAAYVQGLTDVTVFDLMGNWALMTDDYVWCSKYPDSGLYEIVSPELLASIVECTASGTYVSDGVNSYIPADTGDWYRGNDPAAFIAGANAGKIFDPLELFSSLQEGDNFYATWDDRAGRYSILSSQPSEACGIWIHNDAGEPIPPFGAMKVIGVEYVGGRTQYLVQQPSTLAAPHDFDSSMAFAIYANDQDELADDQVKFLKLCDPFPVQYEPPSLQTVEIGTMWDAIPDSFQLGPANGVTSQCLMNMGDPTTVDIGEATYDIIYVTRNNMGGFVRNDIEFSQTADGTDRTLEMSNSGDPGHKRWFDLDEETFETNCFQGGLYQVALNMWVKSSVREDLGSTTFPSTASLAEPVKIDVKIHLTNPDGTSVIYETPSSAPDGVNLSTIVWRFKDYCGIQDEHRWELTNGWVLIHMEMIVSLEQTWSLHVTTNASGYTGNIEVPYYYPELQFHGNFEILPIKGVG